MSDSRSPSESALDAGLLGFAPPALVSFFLRCSFAISSGVVELKNAMRLLSGDHTGLVAPFGRSVMMLASPPASDRIASCGGRGLPFSSFSPPRMNAMRLPSGAQRGCASCLPLVRRMGASLPEVATIQMEVSYPVRFSSVTTRVKTTRDPSGETCGSAIQTKLNRSFSVIARFAAPGWELEFWAASEVTIARRIIGERMTAAIKRDFMGILEKAAAPRGACALCYAEREAVKRLKAAAKFQFPSPAHARRSAAPRRCRRAPALNCRRSCALPVSPGQPCAR